jgi:PEP-CTERM motif
MRGNILVLLAVALTCVCGVAKSTPIVYNVDIAGQGETVTSTITTDGVIGGLVAADITAWSLTASGPIGLSINSSLVGAGVSCAPSGCGLTASLSDLIYNFADSSLALYFRVPDDGSISLFFSAFQVAVGNGGGPNFVVGTGPIIATASGSVPEPGTFALLGLALVGFGFARKRFPGRRSTAV